LGWGAVGKQKVPGEKRKEAGKKRPRADYLGDLTKKFGLGFWSVKGGGRGGNKHRPEAWE